MEALKLSAAEARVLGALVEKEATTPEYYPLSLNALMNACNQKSSRDPVMTLDEEEVRHALRGLERQGLAGGARASDARVAKFEHRLAEVFNFRRDESAILCCLLLRGPQTPGELRSRTERIFALEDTDAVLAGLDKLRTREPALVQQLPRQPGSREARWVQMLCVSSESELQGTAMEPDAQNDPSAVTNPNLEARVAELEREVARLRSQLDALAPQPADATE